MSSYAAEAFGVRDVINDVFDVIAMLKALLLNVFVLIGLIPLFIDYSLASRDKKILELLCFKTDLSNLKH